MASTNSSEVPNSSSLLIPPGGTFQQDQVIIVVSIALTSVATVFLLLRIYARFFVLNIRSPGWSLSLASLAWLFGVPTSVLWAVAARHGLGTHLEFLEDSPYLRLVLLCEWIGVALSLFAAWFGKAAAMVYILDVQGPTHRRWRWILFILVGGNLLLNIGMVPILFLQCTPVYKLWQPLTPGYYHTMRTYLYSQVIGAWGAATDLTLALYPIIMIQRLQIRRGLKVLLCFLLGLGVLTAGCAIIKTIFFCALRVYGDPTFDNGGFIFWSLAEIWCIVITTSVPPLWPLMRRFHSSAVRAWSGGGSSDEKRGPGSDNKGSKGANSRIRHFFYRQGSEQEGRHMQAQRAKQSPFGKWGLISSQHQSQDGLTFDDGIRVTRNVSVSSVYCKDEHHDSESS